MVSLSAKFFSDEFFAFFFEIKKNEPIAARAINTKEYVL